MRLLWLVLIVSQIVGFATIDGTVLPRRHGVTPNPALIWMNLALLVTAVPLTLAVRTLIFQRSQIGGRIPAKAYFTCNILFWAACDFVSSFAMVSMVLNGSMWPSIIFLVIPLCLQASTFPAAGRMDIQR